MIPGLPKITPEQQAQGEKEMKNFEVIINSMTMEERANPSILKYSRKIRISNGCGKSVADLNRMLKKFETMKETMKKMESYRKSGKNATWWFRWHGLSNVIVQFLTFLFNKLMTLFDGI